MLVSGRSLAQPRVVVEGGLALAQVYDDDVFAVPGLRSPDDFWRLMPHLGLGLRTPRLTLDARYEMAAETYRRHDALDDPLAAQDASLALGWSPTRRLTAETKLAYAEARTPGALNTVTGLEAGRLGARRLQAAQSLAWRGGARTRAIVDASALSEDAGGRFRTDTVSVGATLERRWGASDAGRLAYRASRFATDGTVVFSHAVVAGWTRDLDRPTRLEFEVGPRFSGHTVGAEVAASLRHRFAHGEAAVTCLQTQTTVVGEPGPVLARGLTVTLSRQVLRSVSFVAAPSAFRVQGRGSSEVNRLDLEVAWRVARRFSVAASHQLSRQTGALGGAPGAPFVHNVVMLRAVTTVAGK